MFGLSLVASLVLFIFPVNVLCFLVGEGFVAVLHRHYLNVQAQAKIETQKEKQTKPVSSDQDSGKDANPETDADLFPSSGKENATSPVDQVKLALQCLFQRVPNGVECEHRYIAKSQRRGPPSSR